MWALPVGRVLIRQTRHVCVCVCVCVCVQGGKRPRLSQPLFSLLDSDVCLFDMRPD